jgi:hypothetical protein
MKSKVLINPAKKRKIPRHFSWVDHRLVRNHYLEKCSCEALALYLFLLTVGDHEGLSYYRDDSILKHLNFPVTRTVVLCRRELIEAGLISYLEGLYQVLDLDSTEEIHSTKFSSAIRSIGKRISDSEKSGTVVSVGSVIDKILGGE